MRRIGYLLFMLATIALPAGSRTTADAPDFSLFSRTWYVHRGILVFATDGGASFS
jgi:hypothetical protein